MVDSKHLTIRNLSPELSRRLKALAEATGTSVNATVLGLLDKALGVDERRRHLEERYATWTELDFSEFNGALKAQRTIDGHLWE
jgi:plasmid stability protein